MEQFIKQLYHRFPYNLLHSTEGSYGIRKIRKNDPFLRKSGIPGKTQENRFSFYKNQENIKKFQ